ncbi:Na+/H+ antiporter NhaC family protein [Fusobacterium sp. MFO224]|uniref:Na+/H+ antiporter NhaC family protein n=1 Tax=Fusobacterium sp. MFO224 TaxID=3378070 RepID=UPI0038529F83
MALERRGWFIEVLKLSPVVLLAILMVVVGLDVLVAAPIATVYAAIVAFITEKFSFQEIVDKAVDNVKEIQLVFFILMLAYAMAETFMASGVGASIIIMSLNFGLTAKTIAVTGIVVTSVLSVAIGTSWGTFAACAPVFLWLNHIVGGNVVLTTAAIAGGACFGDNIGLISDTTVVSSGIQKVEVIHRIKHQGVWSLGCLFLSILAFYVASVVMGLPDTVGSANDAISQIPQEVWAALAEKRESAVILLNQVQEGVPLYMMLPLVIVLITAIKGLPTLLCLFSGIISALVFGLFAGTITSIPNFINLMYTGFEGAGSWVIVMMMWVAAFGGIMGSINAFEPLSRIAKNLSKNVRQLMFFNGVFSILGNAALSDEMAQIVTIGPIIRNLVDENVEGTEEGLYKLKLRNATFSDALGVFGSQLIPWHVYIGFYVGIASVVYPLYHFTALDIIRYNFLAMIAVVSILVLTLTGLDRLIPLFGLPKEPEVRLKK